MGAEIYVLNPIMNCILHYILHYIMNHYPPFAVRRQKYRGHPARDTGHASPRRQAASASCREICTFVLIVIGFCLYAAFELEKLGWC